MQQAQGIVSKRQLRARFVGFLVRKHALDDVGATHDEEIAIHNKHLRVQSVNIENADGPQNRTNTNLSDAVEFLHPFVE